MLLWAAAALLPILIHLWSRRRFQTTQWAAMTFLMAAMKQNARRVRLEQWLLLAVRTLLLLLFAFALADPMFSMFSSWQMGERSGRTHTLIVVDGSFSMAYRPDKHEEQTLFDAAKAYARSIVEESAQGDAFTLVLMAEPPRVVIGQPAFGPDDVLQEIDALQIVHAGADIPGTITATSTILRQTEERYPRLSRHQVFFLSDMQRTSWQEVNSAEVRRELRQLATNASLVAVDFGELREPNLAVTRLESLRPISTLAADSVFRAELQSFSPQPMPQQRVTWRVDGALAAEERIDLAPLEKASLSFTHRFAQAGEHLVEVHLNDDALPIDNQRWLSVPARESLRVLCIYGRPKEAEFVALALEPRQEGQLRVKVDQAAESAIVETDLSPYDCLVVCNVARFSADEAAILCKYVSKGGGLIVFLGDQVQADSYNQQLGSLAEGQRLLPADIGMVSSESQYRVNPLDYRHPIAAPFRGHENSGLLTTPIWTYAHLELADDSKVALAFDNGDPLLVEGSVGLGHVLLFATAASPLSLNRTTNPPTPWTAISTWPSFPPLVQEMLNVALSGRAEGRNQSVGDDLSGDVPNATADTPAKITLPGGNTERIPIMLDSSGAHWSYGGATISGPYRVQLGSHESMSHLFTLNVDARESDLEGMPHEMLPSQLSSGVRNSKLASTQTTTSVSTSYFRELLLGVAGLALIELMLAWHLGRGAG